jgi:hypothetical protein
MAVRGALAVAALAGVALGGASAVARVRGAHAARQASAGAWGAEAAADFAFSAARGAAAADRPADAAARDAAPPQQPGYVFTPYDGRLMFVRVYFEPKVPPHGRYYSREPAWHHDYPYAETNLTSIVGDVSYARVLRGGNVIAAGDPELMRFPVAWIAEPGYWVPDEKECANLRAYLHKGGFLIFDDFSSDDLPHLVEQMRRVVPELRPIDLDGSEPIFHSFFDIAPQQLRLGGYRARREPERYLGYFEGNDRTRRQVAIVDSNNDIGEFMEYNDTGFSPVDDRNAAFKLGVNYLLYALSH